jgi:hypothetical protein
MKLLARGLFVVGCVLAAGCSLPEGKRGESCERSAQCADGLVCVEHRCGTNLDAVAEGSTVPDLGDDDAGGAAVSIDGATEDADAASPLRDAAMSTGDAATGFDAALDTSAGDEDGG